MKKDPIILKKIGNKKIYIHKSHRLPEYRKLFPFYDRALPGICQSVKEIDGHLTLIDVGANVGDSVALITDKVFGKFLCIEGDKKYLPVLEKNITKFKGSTCEIEPNYCGDGSIQDLSVINVGGTAKLVTADSSENTVSNVKTLDQIISSHPNFKSTNILKIDTDGFEINVIKGATKFLQSTKPVIYFEFTPEFYQNLKQDPMELIVFLFKAGYESALFYDNFGRPIKIVNLSDISSIKYLISQIDKQNIWYYDILVFHNLKPKYSQIFTKALLGFSNISTLQFDKLKLNVSNQIITISQLKEKLFDSQAELQNIISELALGKHQTRKQLNKIKSLEKDLESTIKNQEILQISLQNIYKSNAWRLLSLYYKVKDKFINK